MYEFSVWAPLAEKLVLSADNSTVAMRGPDDQGWWHACIDSAVPGSDYGFIVDDDPRPYPDARSLWQPNGVHALSRVYDQNAFRWTDGAFQPLPISNAIVYELHIGTFTPEGTLDAAIEKFDALKELGITHVELLPVAAFAGRHGWGYDGVSLFAVHEPYGGPDALKRFVNAAHCKGLAVLLDVVYNHFGPAGNYTGKFGPYVTPSHHTPWGGAVNLEDAWSHQVRRFFIDNALMWLRDFHMDGLRLDAVHALVDRSAIHFLEQLAIETKALEATLARPLVLVAESDLNDPRIVTARDAGGFGLHAQWSDDFHHALFALLTPEPQSGYYEDFGDIGQLKKAIEETFVYDGIYAKHRRRVHGRSARHLPQGRFLGYIQNHDQVGNRAQGERLHESVGFDRAKVAAALVLLSPFIPMIFQGEEWAAATPFLYFADHDDPELARSVSEGRRREFAAFGWDPSQLPDPEKEETFLRSKLNWHERTQSEHAEMLTWYRDLILLRRTTPGLNDAEANQIRVNCDAGEQWLEMDRGPIRVVCNLGEEARWFPAAGGSAILLSSHPGTTLRDSTLIVQPDSVAVVGAASTMRAAEKWLPAL